jgi:hypothetical protein
LAVQTFEVNLVSETVLWVFFVLMLVMTIIYNGLILLILRRLRRLYPQTWENLGRPSFLNNSILNSLRVVRFILKGEFQEIDDVWLTSICKTTRVIFFVISVIFVSFVLLMFLFFKSTKV